MNFYASFAAAAILFFSAQIIFPASAQETDVREELETGIIATPRQRAELFVENEDWEKLAAHARKWTREFPGESEAWRYLGRAHRERGEPQAAVDAFSRAWELSDKKNFRIIESIGDGYAEIKEWESAEAAYRAATKLRDRRAELWAKLADVLFLARQPGWREDAARALKKVLSFGQYVNDHARWRQYAEILDVLDADLEQQYVAYRHVVRLKVRDIPAWERLYEIEETRGNDERTEKIADNLFRLDRKNAVANLHFGMRALDGGQRARAVEHLNIALENEEIPAARRSRIYAALGDIHRPAAALQFYRDAVRSDPANITAWERAIVILRGQGRRAEAQKVYEELLAAERKLKRKGALSSADAPALLQTE